MISWLNTLHLQILFTFYKAYFTPCACIKDQLLTLESQSDSNCDSSSSSSSMSSLKGESFVVDFQAFKSPETNKFILKELAIISVDSELQVHCLVKPPCSYEYLNNTYRRRVDFLTNKCHGIQWQDGYIKYRDALQLLRDTVRNASTLNYSILFNHKSDNCM
jgi:hypothetical protein